MDDSLKQYRIQFKTYLEGFDKDNALEYIIKLLSEGSISVIDLYEEIITPTLNSIVIGRDDEDTSIWREHISTNIARTIIECAYPYVLKERENYKKEGVSKRVIVLCPEEEYHEIGARIGADFFTITNCDVFYIGCNTPRENFLSAINALKPDIIAISITNYLNLVSLNKIVADLKEKIGSKVMIVLSGSAFKHTMKTAEDFGADALVSTFKDIDALRRNK